LLLEYRNPWGPDVLECELPQAAEDWIENALDAHPQLRLLLIRGEQTAGPLAFFIASTNDRWASRFELPTYEALAELDLAAMLADEVAVEAHGGVDAKPIYLVCANQERDGCCGEKSIALYRALLDLKLDAEVWQCTHLGGHRFAPTLLYLPDGVHYGRLKPSDAEPLADAHSQRLLFELDNYRGSTRLSVPVQAAEAWLREHVGERRIDGIEVLGDKTLEAGRHMARFRTMDMQIHRVTVAPRSGKFLRLASCDASEPQSPIWYSTVRHEAHTGREDSGI